MILRIARHSNDINAITGFYTRVMGLEVLGSFENHNGYNGIFLGKEGLGWHLEFTQSSEPAVHTFDEDDLLVFYPETKADYNTILNNLAATAVVQQIPKNPYWKENGILVKDPDGYGVILTKLRVADK